ncbi:hypothetical protein [Kurthia senegalensis]|uniref:hypothetical protein n=1 Tax=Kurthia senegalensis TaxID=1033740 RepID=UPI000289DCF5|nr:hypothetical protein [Kurthia senegalensis]
MKKLLFVLVCMTILCACQNGNSEAYNQKVESGLWKVGDAKFHEAYVDFNYAEQQSHSDQQAATYKKQVHYILEAIEASEDGEKKGSGSLTKKIDRS